MFTNNLAIVRTVVTETIPIDPYPSNNNGKAKKGFKIFCTHTNTFWKTNCSYADVKASKTLFGKVSARLKTISDIRTLAVSYSAFVRPFPKIVFALLTITTPQIMQTTAMIKKITINIPFNRLTSSSSFFALALE